MHENMKELERKRATGSAAGDYLQVLFERTTNSDLAYVLIERQSDLPDGDERYI